MRARATHTARPHPCCRIRRPCGTRQVLRCTAVVPPRSVVARFRTPLAPSRRLVEPRPPNWPFGRVWLTTAVPERDVAAARDGIDRSPPVAAAPTETGADLP